MQRELLSIGDPRIERSGKIQGILPFSVYLQVDLRPENLLPDEFDRIPYSTEQGILISEQGIILNYQGIFGT